MTCEDHPACGHTPQDPCEPQWYDAPGAFDTSIPGNEHALCDHENGECDVWEDDEEEEEVEDDDFPMSMEYPDEDAAMEFGLFGSET